MHSVYGVRQEIACYKAGFLVGLNRKSWEVLRSRVPRRQYKNCLAVQIGKYTSGLQMMK